MSQRRGFFKSCLIGCGGLIAFMVLIAIVAGFGAWRSVGDRQVEEQDLALAEHADYERVMGRPEGPGTVELRLGQGEFYIHPGRPGEDVRVEAEYDVNAYELADSYEPDTGSGWTYRVGFRRTQAGLSALLASIFAGGSPTEVHVYLPPDVPIALDARVTEGGLEAELGGLWLTKAYLEFARGGFALDIDEPTREPLESLVIRGKMGGFEARRLGNASPGLLDVDCRMGGADIDLRGAWANDCDVRLGIRMGGMAVGVPDEVVVRGANPGGGMRVDTGEVPTPVLTFVVDQSMGEIEIMRR